MKDQQLVQRIGYYWIDFILFRRQAEHHFEEAGTITQEVIRIVNGVANGILISPCCEGWHLCQREDDREVNVFAGPVWIQRLRIKSRLRAEQRCQYSHRVS